jgi:hypothetical protein
MIIANTTGGMQDQMRFVDKEGKWIEFSKDFPSNHRGTYKEHGEWAIPIYPSNISLVGSVPTPYIFDDRCSFDDIAKAIETSYSLSKEERTAKGKLGREWVTSEEAKMSAAKMCENVIESLEETFDNFQPRPRFELIKVLDKKPDYIEHKLVY